MKVFVTGGGGFLGLALVEQLLAAGFAVASYSRQRYATLQDLGVEQHRGSVTDYPTLKRAMQGCAAVFHAAAKVGHWGRYAGFYEVNVRGTEYVLRACRELDIRYLVYTSTPSVVYAGGSAGEDESLPYPERFDAPYPQTKALAEQAVLRAHSPALTTCALRPHLIWGPRDRHFLPVFFERRRAGRLRLFRGGPYLVDTIYVDNAARAHVQALRAMLRDPAVVGGKAYFLSQDEPIPIRDFVNRLLATGGLPPAEATLDPRLVRPAVRWLERIYHWLRIRSEPPVTLFLVKNLSSSHWFDISAAKRDFGYSPAISIDEGMRRLATWVGEGDISLIRFDG